MEIYSNTTRFAFACNQSNKIIEPLQSRCAILRYARLTDGQVVQRLLQVIEAEKVEYSDDGLAALVFSAEGDMRQALNNLQSTWAGFGFVSGDNVFRVVDSPHPVKVQAMIKACYECKIDNAIDTLKELWLVHPLSVHIASKLTSGLGIWDTHHMISSVRCFGSQRRSPLCRSMQSLSSSKRSASLTCGYWRGCRHSSSSAGVLPSSARLT